MAYVMEDMGITNNLWHLALHDRALVGVDPFDEDNLTFEMKGRITRECKVNPWYYFREIGRISVEGALEPVMIQANRGNLALWWCYFNHATTFLIQPRQTGKSVTMTSLDRYLLSFGLVRSSIHWLTKEDPLRRRDVERLKEYEDILPSYLRRSTKKDPNNQEYIYLSALENRFETHVPRGDEKGAYKVGRGFTSANIRVDEFSYISWLKATLTTILSTTNAAFESARANNSHHGIILATTAGKKDERDGKYAYEILSKSFPFTEQIYNCKNHADLVKMVEANSTNGFAINCSFNHRQLGISDETHYKNVKKAMIDGEDADRDYFNIWTSGGVGSPLTPEQLDCIRLNQREDFVAEVDPKTRFMTKWYVSLGTRDRIMAEGNVVLGLDTSEGQGKDEIALQYVDMTTMEVIGSCFIKMTNIIEFALWLFDRLQQWPKLVLIPERRSTGGAVIDQLLLSFKMAGQNAFKRIFNRVVQDPDKHKEVLEEIRRADKWGYADLYVRYKQYFGYNTSGSGDNARSILYGQVLQNAVRHAMDRINDVKTINQILALVYINNRVDHPKGGNDDGVVAWLLPHWMAQLGQNLSYYGLDVMDIMHSTLAKKSDSELSHFEREQKLIREQIQELIEKLANTKDHFVVSRLENDIRAIGSRLVEGDGETFSLTDMIKKTRENKKLNRHQRGEKGLFDDIYRNSVDRGETV